MVSPLKFEREVRLEPEALFLERYDRMLAWSLQFTGYDRELAEDLLHDMYVQFTLNPIDIEAIANLDGYLYVMLRNLHLAQQRRANRNRLVQLSIVEYDSAHIGLTTVDLRDELAARDDLRRVCLYACARKEHAKIASVLILRFFHGYYPDEIARVAACPRGSVDKWLKLARGEARASIENSGKLAFITRKDMPESGTTEKRSQAPTDFLEELRETIFRSRRGACFTSRELKDLYIGDPEPVECTRLAHMVSCRTCLDGANRLLGLSLLEERRATETLTRDSRKKDGDDKKHGGGDGRSGGTGGGVTDTTLNKLRRKVKDILVHRPEELFVAVNGYALGSHRISATRSELNLVVERADQINFIEVYSEQKMRMLLHNVDEQPPAGPGERRSVVRLSDDRLLELNLRFTSPSPTVQVIYLDPTFSNEVIDLGVVDKAADLSVPPADRGPREGIPSGVEVAGGALSESKWGSRDIHTSLLGLDGEIADDPKGFFSRLFQNISTLGFWLRPSTIAVAVSCLLVASVLYFSIAPSTTEIATAPAVLKRATDAELALAGRTDFVVHRTINLEERNAASGELRFRRRIDIWQSGERGSARRLFDEQGRLIAGEFTTNGINTVYTRKQRTSTRSDATPKSVPPAAGVPASGSPSGVKVAGGAVSSDTAWQLALSAKDFDKLIGQADKMQLSDISDRYAISFERPDQNAYGLVKANLVINKSDLRPVEQTLLVRRAASGPNAAEELIEYRFVESAFEQRAPDTVAPSVFEPDPELLVPDAAVVTKATEESVPPAVAVNESVPPAPTAGVLPNAIATADLEVEVLRLLNAAGADIDDQTNVARTSDGKLQVSGLVDTKERKSEILRALAPVAGNPALIIRVETYAEAAARQKPPAGAPTTVERIEVNSGRIAVYDDVSRYLGKSGDDADEAVRRFSASVLNRSRLVMSEAGTLKKLAGRFSKDDLAAMSPDARAKWLAVVRAHARTCEQETRRLRQGLAAVFFQGSSASGGGNIAINSDAELQQAAARLFNEAAANDRVIRVAFTISAGDSAVGSPIRTQQFLRALIAAENLAAALQKVR